MTPYRRALGIALLLALPAVGHARSRAAFCSTTGRFLYSACTAGAADDRFTQKAICANITDATERGKCLDESDTAFAEAKQECKDRRAWREDACKVLGEGRYDPSFDPTLFDDPKHPTKPNPYFPLAVGDHWEYRSADERNTVDVLDATKAINGLTCIVVRDQVFALATGELTEDTDDWYVPAKDGAVWYCGEGTKSLEIFPADNPPVAEIVSIDGSFKNGRDHDKAGIIFEASPKVDDAYFEEFSLNNAEDFSVILSTTYSFGQDAELDRLVPQDLAQFLCHGDCVVTKNISLLEPGVVERKYYTPGIGVFLETAPDSGEVDRLVSCNVDSRCASLPQP